MPYVTTRRLFLTSGAILAAGLALAACNQAAPVTAGPAAAEYTVASVDVGVAPDAVFSLLSLDGMSDAEQAEKIKAEVKRAVTVRATDRRGGPKKANLEVVLRLVDVASGAGRVLAAKDSEIVGDVRLIDSQTRKVIAFQPNLHGIDKGARNESSIGVIPVGAMVSLAVNAAGADATYRTVAEAYAGAVGRWLIE